ncbi:MAG: hypothetical protein N4A49_13355 [Marinifilaceae bacterium]|jgi:hypothetical protein|nr:hypothetical protein [Marinifilaceae bacterium]
MLKNLCIIFAAFALLSCNSAKKKSTNDNNNSQEVSQTIKKAGITPIADLFGKSEAFLGKEVKIEGKASHVCQHSGKKLFLENADKSLSVQIVRKDELKFENELISKKLVVTGIVKGNKISKEEIAKWEAKLKEEAKKEEEEGHCDTENNTVLKMKKWMKDNGKDYYLNLYLEFKSLEIAK